ncbi:MAG TPA: hypothetical protein VGG91_04920 [Myxococcaceae bacterium]
MRLGPALGIVLAVGGCSNERCLELRTDGVQPSPTTWIVASGTQEDEPRPSMFVFLPPEGPPAGVHTAACIGAFGGATWHFLVWFDDSGQSPSDTYCKDLLENPSAADCSPRPGQPFGEKTFHVGRGLNTVTVTIHPP